MTARGQEAGNWFARLFSSARGQVQERANNILNGMKGNLEMNAGSIVEQEKTLQKYKIEWHDPD